MKKKIPKHRCVNAASLRSPKFRAKIIPNKKKEIKLKHKKQFEGSDKFRISCPF